MLQHYVPILLFIAVALIFGLFLLLLGFLIGPYKPSKEKNSQYECGFPPFSDARMQFDVRYYLVAILFIIFDLEIAFLFPWATVIRQVGVSALIAVMVFLGILTIGFIYEWKKGALEWE
jgi:NADH-quinone oxidoreductase subunit A